MITMKKKLNEGRFIEWDASKVEYDNEKNLFRFHFCMSTPCPLQDKEISEVFTNGFTSTCINPK